VSVYVAPNRAGVCRILIAEDDPDDQFLAQGAFEQTDENVDVTFVEDGQALIDHLCARVYNGDGDGMPDLLLVDINMPRKNGREAILEIKSHKDLRHIPIIAYSTSNFSGEVQFLYQIGANSFVVKPNSFEGWITTLDAILKYWFRIVELPRAKV